MFAEIFQRQENEVKECGLKTVNEVRASNFLAGSPEFLVTPLVPCDPLLLTSLYLLINLLPCVLRGLLKVA